MDIQSIRTELKRKPLYDIPLRVTFYARVSSSTDEQLNSLENQVSYYENYIKKNEAWSYVPGYIDEGLSGISTKKRQNFNRMVNDAKNGRFDLIVTKEISRFARNTLDSLQYTRELLSRGVGVFFQNDNINTLDEDSELRLTIMSSMAQDELRKLSSRVKFGHQQAIKSKVVLGNGRIIGYNKSGKHLVVDEEQAKLVRKVYELYSTDEYSLSDLEKRFYAEGYRNSNGNKISHNTLSGIIANPKYKGYYVGNKVRVVDMFTKKQKFLPPEEWVMFKDETGEIVPAIVSEELWEKANEVLRRRSDDVKNRKNVCNHANLLTGKLFCTHCGQPFYRRESKDKHGNVNSKWVCAGKINNGASTCPTFSIYEEEIKPILFEVFNDTRANTDALIEEYIEMYKSLMEDDGIGDAIREKKKKLDLAEKKQNKLLEMLAEDLIDKKKYAAMSKTCDDEIETLSAEIDELENELLSQDEYKKHIDEIRSSLAEAVKEASTGAISKDFVDRYIDKIFVTMQDDGSARLDIKIFTGESSQKYLKKLREQYALQASRVSEKDEVRSGNMFKKMIEKYESDISAK